MFFSCLANNRLAVMARHIMKPYSIIVEVVENSQARLIPLPVVWLGAVTTEMFNVKAWR
jgi:hypothetical protein